MSRIVQPGLTNDNPALREVDLEHAKRRAYRTEALVSLYWRSWSLPLKQSFNRALNKSTLVNPIRLSRTWKETKQIPKLHAIIQHIKINFLKTTSSINAHHWGYKWGRHSQR